MPVRIVSRREERGFTLIELMMAVAIIGALASIATPLFLRAQLKARRAELFNNLQGIGQAEMVMHHQMGKMVDLALSPSVLPGRTQADFEPDLPGWPDLAFLPDGKVYCQYWAQRFGPEDGAHWVRAHAVCDIDGDGHAADWWIDIDPEGVNSLSQNMVIRPSPPTAANDVF